MLNISELTHFIASTTDVCVSTMLIPLFEKCFELQKSANSHSYKLSPSNLRYAINQMFILKTTTAAQIIKTLANNNNQSLPSIQFAFT